MKGLIRSKLVLTVAALVMFAVATALPLSGSIMHSHAVAPQRAGVTPLDCGSWRVVPSPNHRSSHNFLNGVVAVSVNNVWAVGDYDNNSGVLQTLIEHWNGTNWHIVPSPNVGTSDNFLNKVAEVSGKDLWAVGEYRNSIGALQTLIEHWNGAQWRIVPSPNVGTSDNFLFGVREITASNIWAVGDSSNLGGPSRTLIEHWNGTNWRVVPSPNHGSRDNRLLSVTARDNPNNVWAVGASSVSISGAINQTLIEHWNGAQWSIVSSPNPGLGDNELSGVSEVSGSDIWAVGSFIKTSSGIRQPLIEHWNGTNWRVVPSPTQPGDTELLAVTATENPNNVWAVGDSSNGTLIEHWNGTSWSIIPSLSPGLASRLFGVWLVPDTNQVWAVGFYANSNNIFQTLTELFKC